MLVIPTIELQNGRCVVRPDYQARAQRTIFADPVKMAKLWRVQNAKTLLVYDHDAAYTDKNNFGFIQAISQQLDIPIMGSGGVRTAEDIEGMLNLGVYQVIAEAHPPHQMEDLLSQFPSNRVGVHLNVRNGMMYWGKEEMAATEYVRLLESLRCYRVVVTARDQEGRGMLAIEVYIRLAQQIRRMRIMVSGGVEGYQDLVSLQALDRKIDSVIVNRALYAGKFACQAFWCWHQKEQLDLDCFSTAPLRTKRTSLMAA